MVKNAKKNVFDKDLGTNEYIDARSVQSAIDYVIYRVAEEETKIFRKYNGCIRSFFIKYAPFYKQYIHNIDETMPHLDCSLIFFTGKKGNITQPWQAVGIKQDGKVVFLSQEKLKK